MTPVRRRRQVTPVDESRSATGRGSPRDGRVYHPAIPNLIVISGPIASGKSTVAKLLAEDLRGRAHSAAVLDLDLIYEMLSLGTKSDEAIWTRSREAAASFAAALLLTSTVEVVILEGEFWTEAARAPIRRLAKWSPRFVTLDVDVETALGRAQGDPARVTSRNPEFLRPHYDSFERLRATFPPTDLVVSSANVSAAEVASLIRERLLPEVPAVIRS